MSLEEETRLRGQHDNDEKNRTMRIESFDSKMNRELPGKILS